MFEYCFLFFVLFWPITCYGEQNLGILTEHSSKLNEPSICLLGHSEAAAAAAAESSLMMKVTLVGLIHMPNYLPNMLFEDVLFHIYQCFCMDFVIVNLHGSHVLLFAGGHFVLAYE